MVGTWVVLSRNAISVTISNATNGDLEKEQSVSRRIFGCRFSTLILKFSNDSRNTSEQEASQRIFVAFALACENKNLSFAGVTTSVYQECAVMWPFQWELVWWVGGWGGQEFSALNDKIYRDVIYFHRDIIKTTSNARKRLSIYNHFYSICLLNSRSETDFYTVSERRPTIFFIFCIVRATFQNSLWKGCKTISIR